MTGAESPSRLCLLVDLSRETGDRGALKALLGYMRSVDGLGPLVERGLLIASSDIDVADDPSWHCYCGTEPILAANELWDTAARRACELLVVSSAVELTPDTVGALRMVALLDPYFGFISPRISSSITGEVSALAPAPEREPEWLSRELLSLLPEYYVNFEGTTPCILVRREIVANFGGLDPSFSSLAGAIHHYMYRARRVGFRCVTANRVIASAPEYATQLSMPAGIDLKRLRDEYPDANRAQLMTSRLAFPDYESLVARAVSTAHDARRTLLLDMSNLAQSFNGTSFAMLGLADGIRKLEHGWSVTVMVKPEAARFHRLSERLPDFSFITPGCRRKFSAAVRLSQPWTARDISRLHELALVNLFMILDTIAWDVLYPSPDGLESTWTFIAQSADGIAYDSDFTRERFRNRFPLSDSVLEAVVPFSFHPDDYNSHRWRKSTATSIGGYVLLIGNDYDHKWLEPTLEVLTSAFPFQEFKVMGQRWEGSGQVEGFESGQLPEQRLDDLFAQAQAVVFPSFYEGFGFPVLKGLSYGKTVLARHSDLLQEVAAQYRGGGRLVSFATPLELVEALGRVLHGLELQSIPFGTAIEADCVPARWADGGRQLLDLVERGIGRANYSRWMARERGIRLLTGKP